MQDTGHEQIKLGRSDFSLQEEGIIHTWKSI